MSLLTHSNLCEPYRNISDLSISRNEASIWILFLISVLKVLVGLVISGDIFRRPSFFLLNALDINRHCYEVVCHSQLQSWGTQRRTSFSTGKIEILQETRSLSSSTGRT